MKTKFGSIIVAGSGKIGGHVASKNRGGAYLRTKVTPINPRSTFQANVRNRFIGLSQAWRGLTQDQRDAWNAATADYARTDIFGDLRNPSGINLYQRLNNVLENIGESAINLPPAPSAVQALTAVSLSGTIAVPTLSLIINEIMDADTALIISATPPLSAGKTSVKAAFRQIDVAFGAVSEVLDIMDAYVAKFGSLGEVGQKIFVRVQPASLLTGQVGGQTIVFVVPGA